MTEPSNPAPRPKLADESALHTLGAAGSWSRLASAGGDGVGAVPTASRGRAGVRSLRPGFSRLELAELTASTTSVGLRIPCSLRLNDLLPVIHVDPETYEVRADGRLLTCEPARVLAMAQRYFLF